MKRYLLILALCLFAGCASWRNDIAADGGLLGTYAGNYVVISESGGVIMDVWVLKDVFVESEDDSDGWRFVDDGGNVVFIGGDVKVLRINDESSLLNYHEYHRELENLDYRTFFKGGPDIWVLPPADQSTRPNTSPGFRTKSLTDELTGRYHLRGRTKGFFGRSRRTC